MNSIRPLITISILIAAGVFLYTKINETPAHLVPGANDAAQVRLGCHRLVKRRVEPLIRRQH